MRSAASNLGSLVLRLVLRYKLVLRWSCSRWGADRWVAPVPRSDPLATAFLLVETSRRGELVWAGKWRSADGTRIKRRLGAQAWVTRDGDRWVPRAGRPKPEHLTERQARRLMLDVIRETEAALPTTELRQP